MWGQKQQRKAQNRGVMGIRHYVDGIASAFALLYNLVYNYIFFGNMSHHCVRMSSSPVVDHNDTLGAALIGGFLSVRCQSPIELVFSYLSPGLPLIFSLTSLRRETEGLTIGQT